MIAIFFFVGKMKKKKKHMVTVRTQIIRATIKFLQIKTTRITILMTTYDTIGNQQREYV